MFNMFNKKSVDTNMNTAEKFRFHSKKALEGVAINYAGQCIAAAGLGTYEGGFGDKALEKAGLTITATGTVVALAGTCQTMYHGYKALEASLDYAADKMADRYADMD